VSVEYLYDVGRRQSYGFVYLLLEDLKRLNNPLTPIPERIAIARTWAGILCRLSTHSACVEPSQVVADESVIYKVVDEMEDFLAREVRSALRGFLRGD